MGSVPLESGAGWATELATENAPMSVSCLSQASVFGKLLLIFLNNAPRKIAFFSPHHYTEQIPPTEITAFVSKNGDCIRGDLTEGPVGGWREFRSGRVTW